MKASELGLGRTAGHVYDTMLNQSRWRFPDLVAELGWDEVGTRRVVGELRSKGFLVGSADEWGAIRAVEPCLALSSHAARRLTGPADDGPVPKASAVGRFISWHERSSDREGRRARDGGLDEVAVVVERLAAEAVSEVAMLVPSYAPGSYEFSIQIAEAVLRRGAGFKAMWSNDFTTMPEVQPHAKWLDERGCAPRTVSSVPLRAVVFDGTVAVVVDESQHTRVVRAAPALKQLNELTTALWASGTSVCEAPVRPSNHVSRKRHEIVLRLLSQGLTDDAVATRIGVSVRTVRNDVAAAMAGMDARSRFQAGVRAAQLGLL